jgi:hypothetical protein
MPPPGACEGSVSAEIGLATAECADAVADFHASR